MRRARTPPRPPLTRRAIVAFPVAADLRAVEAFRELHDPQALAIAAHLTLVFPFASALSSLQIATHVRRVAARWPVLPISLEGVDAHAAQWVHLRVTRGREPLVELHDRLYRRVLAAFLSPGFEYLPHLTIARASDARACDALLAQARATFTRPIEASLRTLSLVSPSSDGRATIDAEIALGT